MEKKKKVMVTVVTVLVLTIGVTFAYFMARTGAGAQSDLNITADTVDDLKFSVSKDTLTLNINQFNFTSGSGNLSDAIKATASLKANSTKKTATGNYYVYFQIESNDYIYTTTDKKPEIVLSITGPNGEITSLDNLSYVTATNADGTEVKGFDITELGASIIKIADSYEISSSSSTNYTNQDWTFTVTFINLDTNQADNEGKTLTGKVLIQSNKLIDSISDVAKSGDTLATTLESLDSKGISQVTGLYHHDSTLTNGAGDNSYRFAGANPNNYVCFGSDEATCPTENLYRIIGLIDGKIKLISADGATTDMLGTDGGYYNTASGAGMPSDYYKGSGDFTKIGVYYWNQTGTNTWSTSTTNTTNLNTNYLTYLDGKNTKWKTMIDDTTWYVGGMTWENGAMTNAKTAYDYEVGANKDANTTVTAKIGMMYLSDYYYGANPEYWTLPGYDENGSWNSDYTVWTGDDYSKAYNDNWMNIGLWDWTLSRDSVVSDNAFDVYGVGYVDDDIVDYYDVLRPSFNLTSSVKYESGDGTASSPIRLKI